MSEKKRNISHLAITIILLGSLASLGFFVFTLISPTLTVQPLKNIKLPTTIATPIPSSPSATPPTLLTISPNKETISIEEANKLISNGIAIDNNFIDKAKGFSTTAILFSGDILASDVGRNGDYYTSSRDLKVPSILHLGNTTWRHLSFDEQQTLALHNPLLTDSYIDWTTDTFNTQSVVDTRKTYLDPLGLLKIATESSTPVSFTKSGAGLEQVLLYSSNIGNYASFFSTIHASASDLAPIPQKVITKKGKKGKTVKPKPPATKIYLQVFLDHFGAITRFLVVLPNKHSLMISIDKYQSLIETAPNIKDVVSTAPVSVNQPVPTISKGKSKKKR
jgi:hypothetical protein